MNYEDILSSSYKIITGYYYTYLVFYISSTHLTNERYSVIYFLVSPNDLLFSFIILLLISFSYKSL